MNPFSLGFIGGGNMARAIIKGVLPSLPSIYVYEIDPVKRDALCRETGIQAVDSLNALTEYCDTLLLAVKPNAASAVLDEIAGLLEGKLLISIVTGLSTKAIQAYAQGCHVQRVMPNMPALIHEGMTVMEENPLLSQEARERVYWIFNAIGKVESVSSKLMDAVTGMSGCGPAYAFLFMEALADGGVRDGLPRDLAYRLAAQTVLGSARMVLGGEHPGKLKDMVTSPGGATIEGIHALETAGFRGAVMTAVHAGTNKSHIL